MCNFTLFIIIFVSVNDCYLSSSLSRDYYVRNKRVETKCDCNAKLVRSTVNRGHLAMLAISPGYEANARSAILAVEISNLLNLSGPQILLSSQIFIT